MERHPDLIFDNFPAVPVLAETWQWLHAITTKEAQKSTRLRKFPGDFCGGRNQFERVAELVRRSLKTGRVAPEDSLIGTPEGSNLAALASSNDT